MNNRLKFFVFLLLPGTPGPGIAQQQRAMGPSHTVAIAILRNGFRVGDAIPLNLTMTNISDHAIYSGGSAPNYPAFPNVGLREMDIRVVDSVGKPVAETDYGMAIHGRLVQKPQPPSAGTVGNGSGGLTGGGSGPPGIGSAFLPGHPVVEQSDLSKEFDLSRPGIYTVQAMDRVKDPDTGQVILSNKLTFTIVP